MPFIGKSPSEGKNNILLDAITTSATATYNLLKDSVAYSPVSAQSLIVSLNGVTQAPINAYTVSGSTIVFASALTSNDVIDYIIASSAPTMNAIVHDASITSAKLASDSVATAKIVDGSVTVDKLAAGTIKTPSAYSVAIGTNALVDGSLSGSYNTAVGVESLKENEGGTYNTAVGTYALKTQTSASYNTAVGYGAGADITTGGYNCIFGMGAGNNLTIGASNNFIGMYAGFTATEANYSTGIGYQALYDLTTANHNVAVGQQALYDTNTGHSNVALGNYAMYGNTTGYLNTACGYGALYCGSGFTGTYNTAVGVQAGYSTTTGYNNAIHGAYAGYAITEGHTNTLIGTNSGYGLLTGDNNTCLGGNAGRAASPSGNITTGNNIICLGDNSITDIYCADTSISSSDERDKADITDFTHGLSWVLKMRPVTYKWDKRSDYLDEDDEEQDITKVTRDGSKKKSKVNVGLIAQEVLAIEQADSFSSSKDNMLCVNLNEDDTGYGIKYERIVPVLINAIKELEARIKVLEG